MTRAAEGKVLLLIRHAKAETWAPNVDDFTRRLTDRGIRDAAAGGEWLHANGFGADHVLCSPSTRTKETCETMAAAGLAEAAVEHVSSLYNASPDAVLRAIRDVDEDADVLAVVGHAPGIPGVASLLADGNGSTQAHEALGQGLPTCGIAVLHYEGTWAGLGYGAACLDRVHVSRG